MTRLRVALGQLAFRVGDLSGNRDRILAAVEHARSHWQADLLVLPELAVTGYPPEDLLFREDFLNQTEEVIEQISQRAKGIALLLGAPVRDHGNLYNSAVLIRDGRTIGRYDKMSLPNFGVFDECRYFQPGHQAGVFELKGFRLGVTICEDLWQSSPALLAKEAGAQCLINLNASPYHLHKSREREGVIGRCVAETELPVIYVNVVGGQDELVFDGDSVIYNASGRCVQRVPKFTEALSCVELHSGSPVEVFSSDVFGVDGGGADGLTGRMGADTLTDGVGGYGSTGDMRCSAGGVRCSAGDVHGLAGGVHGSIGGMCANGIADAVSEEIPTLLPSQAWEEEAEIYAAIVMGVRDYVRLNGFDGAVLGLSGGIDSALVLAIAADALGPDAVEAVMMPTVYTAQMSLDDACKQAQTLGVKYHVIPIQAITAAFDKVLQPLFEGLAMDTTEENIQARSRGMILMAISNKMRKIVLTTGNKSEMAVGYATLYGDMAGGFAPIKDLPKMWVYRLARYRNSVSAVIPQRVIDRPPSAELRPDQKDEDTLPPYPVLDEILERYIHQDQSIEEMVRAGLDEGQVREVVRLVDLNEYKRRQAAPGVKVGVRAFGRDRRYPITSGFRHRALAEPDQSIQAAPLFQSLLKSGSENTGPESNGTENTGSDSTGSESKGAERDG